MTEPARFRYREPAPRLWPWILFALACLLALGAIGLWAYPTPDPPPPQPPPPRSTPITVYRPPPADLERVVESVKSV